MKISKMQNNEELPDYQYDENEGEEHKQADGAAKYVNTTALRELLPLLAPPPPVC